MVFVSISKAGSKDKAHIAAMNDLLNNDLSRKFTDAIAARDLFLDVSASRGNRHAFRLFNGHLEGNPDLVVDIYGSTALIQNSGDPLGAGDNVLEVVTPILLAKLPWIEAIVLKERNGTTDDSKQGRLIYGEKLTSKIQEYGVWYAIDLMINQDASFYLDTRGVRQWAQEQLAGKRVLNTFAYTGSLGVAAMAGGAAEVVHTDLNKRFLNMAKTSYTLNGFPINKKCFQTADFFPFVARQKRLEELFDCIFLDPPFFSTTDRGTVNLAEDGVRLINKLRPLVKNGGRIVAINNAIYLSGSEYMQSLERLCEDGFVEIEELLPVPSDIIGYAETIQSLPITDPAPFNHSTKIAILRIGHKT